MNLVEVILKNKAALTKTSKYEVPIHIPEMLLVGCVDARKDPIADLGIEKGKALIFRNIAALIRGKSVTATQRETEAAALEFAVKVMKVKHIVVMGHTDCGGIHACMTELDMPEIQQYLSPLSNLRNEIQASSIPLDEKIKLMGEEAIKMSVKNLLSYDYIQEAVDAGKLTVNGWVIDIASSDLTEIA